jgi:hypothetical protein
MTLKIDRHGISVTDPQTGEQITYSREGQTLVAHDLLQGRLDRCSASFLAQACKAAHAEAVKMGWLRS